MKVNKSRIAMILTFCSILLFVSACSGSGSNNAKKSEGSKDATKEVTISFRSTGSDDALNTYFKSGLVEQFESENPGIKIKLAPILASEGDYFSKVVLQMKSEDTAPDIVAEDTSIIKSDAQAGYLEKLDSKVNAWSDWNNITESLKEGVKGEDGSFYGIPATTDTRGLWYNKDLFKKAGLPVPWEPKNWEDVLNAARTIKSKLPDVTPMHMTVGKASGEGVTMQTLEMLLYGTQDQLYDFDTKKWIVNSPGLLDSFKFINQVFNVDKTGPSLQIALSGQAGSMAFEQLLPKDKMAIGLDGSWAGSAWFPTGPSPIENVTDKMGFVAMPTQNGQDPGATTMSGGWAWSIPAKAKDKDDAWKFLQFIMNKENATKRVIAEGALSPRTDSIDVSGYLDRPFVKEAQSFVQYAHFRPTNDKYASVSTQLQGIVESIASGKLTPEDAVKQFKDSVSRVVGADQVEEK